MKKHLLEMGGLVEHQLGRAVSSLLNRDSGQATLVLRGDRQVNAMELQIDEECSRILARRQPAASDLRLVLAVTKSTTDLERIGDEATRIARQATKLSELPLSQGRSQEIRKIADHVTAMLTQALDSFARLDVSRAIDVVTDDNDVHREYEAITTSLVDLMKRDSQTISSVVHEMWALQGLERVGDHASNIARQVVYLVLGRDVRHMTAQELRSLFKVDDQ